jgi:hypothetical protein
MKVWPKQARSAYGKQYPVEFLGLALKRFQKDRNSVGRIYSYRIGIGSLCFSWRTHPTWVGSRRRQSIEISTICPIPTGSCCTLVLWYCFGGTEILKSTCQNWRSQFNFWGFHGGDYEVWHLLWLRINTYIVTHRRHITSPLQSPAS